MNVKRKILNIVLILLLFFQLKEIKAISINEKTAGTSAVIETVGICGDQPADGCSYWSKDFKIKVTLIDKDMKIIYKDNGDGTKTSTKTVEFRPYNPYIPGNYGTYNVGKMRDGGEDMVGAHVDEWMDPKYMHEDAKINYAYAVNYSGENNLVFGVTQEQVSEIGYWIYMGFGYCEKADENCKPVANDFSDYEVNRQKFVKFVKSYERKIHVEDGDFVGDVSFIDFFLKVCGYTDVWDYTINEENLDKLNEYYLEIEPIYTMSVAKNGRYHRFTATAKTLGNLLYWNKGAWKNNGWFGIFNWFEEPRYNFLCNMYDKSGFLNNTYRYNPTTTQAEYLKQMEKICLNPSLVDQLSTEDMSNYLGWVDSPFGINILKVTDDSIKHQEKKYNSNVSVNSCQNDSFKYELNMTGADDTTLFNSVYPNNIDADKLNDYYYHVGENGNELWCYDNISYDFSDLKNEIGNKTIQAGKIVNLPNGKLTVNRTCYSKSDETKLKGYLEQVFKNDPATYQDTFNFTFGNETYTYKRNTQRYAYKHSTSGIKLDHANKLWYEESTTNSSTSGHGSGFGKSNDYHKYTSTFYYDYEVDDASKNINSVNINNYSLSETISGTNSIDFLTHFDNAIVVKSQKEKNKTYMNTLSANMNDAYGLSNKLYNKLRNEASITQDVNGTFTYESTSKIEKTDLAKNIKYIVNLKYDEIEKQSCELQTTIKDENPLGDGLKFRVISLSNPFPARDGTGRMAGYNWLTRTENNVYNYIQNNRNVNSEEVYQKEPLYTVTLDAQSMVKIREYNKSHSYSDSDITCEEGTGRMCIDNFIRNDYINLDGVCKDLKSEEMPVITQMNKEITNFIINGCAGSTQCMQLNQQEVQKIDNNKDGYVDEKDYLDSKFYTCADKTAKSGG